MSLGGGFHPGFALLLWVIAFGLRVWVIVSVLGYESVEVRFQEFQLWVSFKSLDYELALWNFVMIFGLCI